MASQPVDDVWADRRPTRHGLWTTGGRRHAGTVSSTAGAGRRAARPQPLCTANRAPDLRERQLSTVSTVATTPTNLYTGSILREHHSGPRPGDNHPQPSVRRRAVGRMPHRTSRSGRPHGRMLIQHADPSELEGHHTVKFRVERDVLADAVAWAARSLPVRPSVPVLAGLLIEAERRRPGALDLRLRDLGPGHARRPRCSDEGRALVTGRLLADICRSLPAKPVEMVLDGAEGLADLRLGPVQPADDAGRGLPDPARHARPPPARCSSDAFAHAVAQAVTAAGRDDMLPVLTGVRIEIDGSTISLLATDRFRLSHRELGWDPRTPDESRGRAGARPGARRHRQVADRRQRGHHRAGRERRRRGHHRLRGRGRRRRTPYDDPAARRRVPQGPQPVPERAPDRGPGRQGRR